MADSDFEVVLKTLKEYPNATAKELAAHIKQHKGSAFTSKNVNQVLYRLLTANLVIRNGSSEKPTWAVSTEWIQKDSSVSTSDRPKVPVGSIDGQSPVVIQIGSTEVRVIFDKKSSVNDPYMSPDWVGSYVLATVNCNHPFWTLRLHNDNERSLFSVMVAQDAYIQWKSSQLHEPPDPRELLVIRDNAMRLTTLSQ